MTLINSLVYTMNFMSFGVFTDYTESLIRIRKKFLIRWKEAINNIFPILSKIELFGWMNIFRRRQKHWHFMSFGVFTNYTESLIRTRNKFLIRWKEALNNIFSILSKIELFGWMNIFWRRQKHWLTYLISTVKLRILSKPFSVSLSCNKYNSNYN